MKKLCLVLLALLVCAGLASGCGDRATVLTDIGAVLGRNLVYLGEDGNDRIIADPAEGKRYVVRGKAGEVLEPVPAFAEFSLSEDGGRTFLSTATALSARAPIIRADSAAAAAAAYPPALLAGMLHNGGEYALQDYAVSATKLLADKDGRVTVEFVADVKPVSDRFAPHAGSSWGKPGSDGFVRGLRLVVDLYEYGGQYCLYEPNWRTFAGGAPVADYVAPETRYHPVAYDDTSLAWEQGNEVEHVLYEDKAYSYVCGVRLRRDRSEYFEATIYRIDAASDERVALFDLKRNTISVKPFAVSGRVLYFGTVDGRPYSEAWPGQIASMNLDTGEYTVLLAAPATVIGGAGGTYYAVGSAVDARPAGVYAVDTAGGTVRKISALPGNDFSLAYEGAALHHISGGRLFVLWPEQIEGVPGPTYATFAIDPVTGTIERQPD